MKGRASGSARLVRCGLKSGRSRVASSTAREAVAPNALEAAAARTSGTTLPSPSTRKCGVFASASAWAALVLEARARTLTARWAAVDVAREEAGTVVTLETWD